MGFLHCESSAKASEEVVANTGQSRAFSKSLLECGVRGKVPARAHAVLLRAPSAAAARCRMPAIAQRPISSSRYRVHGLGKGCSVSRWLV
eukprot:674265-Rhodomonas_salina.4